MQYWETAEDVLTAVELLKEQDERNRNGVR
jgi:hypothetical protein